jgi:hypothetical protein
MLARLSIMVSDRDGATGWIAKIRSSPQTNAEDLAQLVTRFRQQFGRGPF